MDTWTANFDFISNDPTAIHCQNPQALLLLSDRLPHRPVFQIQLIAKRRLKVLISLPACADFDISLSRLRQELRQTWELTDLRILQGARIVGMTTTGVAKQQQLIQALGPRVIVVEEAAEVLEAHVLTSLSSRTEHVILIGKDERSPFLETFGKRKRQFESRYYEEFGRHRSGRDRRFMICVRRIENA